jgi:hypothetical protein
VSFHTYIPNFYIGENNFFYSGLNEGCDISAVAVTEIPSPTTTTTTTVIYYCNLSGTAVVTESSCTLEGTAACTDCTTTTTSTTTSTTSTTSTTTTLYPCNEYRIENNTEVSIGVSWYDCNGVLQSDPNVGSGNQLTFCANLSFGPIETGGGSLFDLGACTL